MTSRYYVLPASDGFQRARLWQMLNRTLSQDVHDKFSRPYSEVLVTVTVKGIAKPRGPF